MPSMRTKAKANGARFADLADLPVVLDVPAAARVASLSTDAAYRIVAAGEWPSPVVRFGKSIRVPTAPLLAALGLSTEDAAARLADGDDAA